MPDPIRSRTTVVPVDSLGNDLAALSQAHTRLYGHVEQAHTLITDLTRKLEQVSNSAKHSPGARNPQLTALASSVHQAVQTFNTQYLLLQNQMQQENRSYTAISNILKTKQDTEKNSNTNVR